MTQRLKRFSATRRYTGKHRTSAGVHSTLDRITDALIRLFGTGERQAA